MPPAQHVALVEAMDRLRAKDQVTLPDALSLAQLSMEAVQTSVTCLDTALCREFRDIAKYIARTKEEVARLQANEMHKKRIPDAGRELDAVVEATEEATTQIMECAETIMAADSSDIESYKELVNTNIMTIFEACSFQDLTGQRIGKVVTTINHIEKRVSRFASAVGAADADGPADEEEVEQAKRNEEQLLHGPQMKDEAQTQDDIDALFG